MKLKSILLICLSLLSALPAFSQFSQSGTDFWLCFMQNYKESKPSTSGNITGPPSSALTLILYISSESKAKVEITCKANNYSTSLELEPNKMSTVMLPPELQITSNNTIGEHGIHITSDAKIYVNALSSRLQTTDGFTVLPVQSTGKDYTISSRNTNQGLNSEFAVVATEDNTRISIVTPPTDPETQKLKAPINITINRGESFQFNSAFQDLKFKDLTGTKITADKKISVFSGHQCSYVPEEILACNFLAEQLLPAEYSGNTFYIAPLAKRTKYSVKIVALESHTIGKINDKVFTLTNAGDSYENNALTENYVIKSDKPVTVAQFSQGNRNGDSVGDPMMILVRPENIYQKTYDVNIPKLDNFENFVNVIIPIDGLNDFSLDGKLTKPVKFNEFHDSRMVSFTLKLSPGYHSVKSSVPFGISVYGFGTYDAYGWM